MSELPKEPEQLEQLQQQNLLARLGLEFTLHVHLSDGTIKDIHCVGSNIKIEKEQDHDDLRS